MIIHVVTLSYLKPPVKGLYELSSLDITQLSALSKEEVMNQTKYLLYGGTYPTEKYSCSEQISVSGQETDQFDRFSLF